MMYCFLNQFVRRTHVALSLSHVHGMLNIRWNGHLVIYRLALFFLKLLFVQFLRRENMVSRAGPQNRSWIWDEVRQLYPADELVDLLAVGGVTSLRQGAE